jgi:uncharacterized ferritin-like protein (DUF455 family)
MDSIQNRVIELIDWSPFVIARQAAAMRSLDTQAGLFDRLRSVAFAEKQAYHAYCWAIDVFQHQLPNGLLEAWLQVIDDEKRHYTMLVNRLQALGVSIGDRAVSLKLFESLVKSTSIETFAQYMATAEFRGKQAGLQFYQTLKTQDPITADIFITIANEEQMHIDIAVRYFGIDPSTR